MNIYLAGAMSYWVKQGKLEEKAMGWRKEIKKYLSDKYNIFDPTENFYINQTYPNNVIVAQNIYYLNKADLCVVNLEGIEYSPGTIFELAILRYRNIPILAFPDNYVFQNINPMHIKYCITGVFENVGDIIDHILNMYCQKFQ